MIQERLKALRAEMEKRGITVYVVPTADFHESEYVGDHFKARKFITGFTGSAGTAVITAEEAGLWTDGRYFVQAENQLKGSTVTLYRMGEEGVPTVDEFVKDKLNEGGCLGFDGRVVNGTWGGKLEKIASAKNASMHVTEDLIDLIWEDRPALSKQPLFILEEKYSGKSTADKIADLRKAMKENGANVHILTSLYDIAWLLNIRGNDIDYVPVVLSYLVLTETECIWFLQEDVVDDKIRAYLDENHIITKPYNAVYDYVPEIPADAVVLMNRGMVNYRIVNSLDKAIKVEIVDWGDYEKPLGWEFVNSPNHINKETGAQFLSELYYNADDDYEGRTTVPALVDYKEKKVVNNDYHHLTNHFETAFKPLHKKGAPDLYPEELREEIDKLNVWLFENVNNAVYRAQFAESLQAFKDGYETFFAGLEAMDKRLENQRFLFGDYITDSDIRLYTTLARFDYSYSRNIGPCVHRLVDYKNLWTYARDLYQIPAFRHNTYFKDFAASEDLTHAPEDYWENVYYDIVVQETDWDTIWSQPTGREALSKDPAHKWKAEI